MIDAHIHLEQYTDMELESMLLELPGLDIESLIAVSMNLDSCIRTQKIAALYPAQVKPAYGFHPEQPLRSKPSFTHCWTGLNAMREKWLP